MIINNSGGAAPLNFKVVGGTAQPNSPSENTIWVNTDSPITSWVFSAEQPENPVEGMLWFRTGTSSTVPFNALKKNNITVCPTDCKQRVGGAWADKLSETYLDGAWVTMVTDLTVVPNAAYSWSIRRHQNVTVNSDGTVVFVAGTSGDDLVYAYVDSSIDFTEYNSMVVTYKTTRGHNRAGFGVVPEGTAVDYYQFIAFANISSSPNTIQTKTIDVSSVTGKQRIGVGEYGGTVNIYSIVLKK